ncbi:protein phosphatase 2C [Histomonas meleagridis]|uniref:protein phosphatase 2C n=1 Tax=Histomonas meleagridis TaxID=135588 RepID=UPI00355A11D4|nr:protein phosphatase 2C [Histomonas meleagridis]KAH0798587.1 protein phosphatase 2C [Histomonas meleagridis]
MEDSLVVFSNIIPNFDLFCVFDGHGGSYTSTICSYEIIKYFQSCDLAEDEINEKFIEQFFECILLKLKEMNVKDGSTLALTLVSNDEIIISHLGDSRVLLIEENGEIRHATIDHKPDDKNEIKRILKEGGKVFKGRVSGTLSIARCLGDFYIPGIGRTPTTVKLELTHEDKWLILGCDGLFDLITNEEIAKIAMKADNPTELAYDLRNIAYHRYSPDNISVIAVDLQKKKTI